MDNKGSKGEKNVVNKGSLVQSIKNLEISLNEMKSTVLVPTLLNNINCDDMTKNGVTSVCADNENLFNVYNDLQKVSQLLYGDRKRFDSKYSDRITDMNDNNRNCDNLNEEKQQKDNLLTKLDFHVRHMRGILDQLCQTSEYIKNVYKEDVQNMHMNYNHIEYSNNDVKHYYTSNSPNEQNGSGFLQIP